MAFPRDSGTAISVIFCGRGKNGDKRRFHWKEKIPENLVATQWFSPMAVAIPRMQFGFRHAFRS
jgi:hypothetical protein